MFAIDGTLNHKGGVAVASHEGTEATATFALPCRECQHLATLNTQRWGHKIVERTAATHQVFHIEAWRSTTCLALAFIGRALLGHAGTVYLPAFGKPAVRQLVVVETLVHLLRRDRLSLGVYSHK